MDKRIFAVAFLVLSAAIISGCRNSTPTSQATSRATCDKSASQAVAKAYAMVWAYPDNLPQFVTQNGAIFATGSRFHACADLLASKLTASALRMPSRATVEKQANDISSRAGRPDLGPKLADDMMKMQGDLQRMATALRDISSGSQGILNGNLDAYHRTNTYQLSQLIWGLGGAYATQQYLITIRNLTYELNRWMMLTLAQQVGL